MTAAYNAKNHLFIICTALIFALRQDYMPDFLCLVHRFKGFKGSGFNVLDSGIEAASDVPRLLLVRAGR